MLQPLLQPSWGKDKFVQVYPTQLLRLQQHHHEGEFQHCFEM